jgi:negative regulator of sigma E activity
MSELERESLSALLDNEADDLELRRILKSCELDAELLETWQRYNLAQSLLHEAAVPVSPALSQRIFAQIATEESPQVPRSWKVWQQNLAKGAIAASVALVFIVAVQTNLQQSSAPLLVEQNEQTPGILAPNSTVVIEEIAFEVDPIAQQRLSDYLESMTIDEEQPPHMEHIQDSPLFRLVNEFEAKP